MKKNRFVGRWATFFLLSGLVSVTVFSCSEKEEDLVKPKTLADVILENDQFSILRDVVLHAGMMDALRTDNITFFAPDNNAFGKANVFSSAVYTLLPADSARAFLQTHMLANKTKLADLKVGNQVTVNRRAINITRVDSTVAINKSDVVIPNVNADNGIIHVIDSLVVR